MKYHSTVPFPVLAALAALAAFAAACSTNVTVPGSEPGAGSSPAPVADCTSRCESKATGCGAPSDQASKACGSVCDGSFTNDQLSCLESKSCSALQTADLSNVCPRSSSNSGGSGTSGGGTSGGSSSTDHFACSLNGACYKCQDSDGVNKCSITSGPGPGCTSTDSSYCEP